ncbi:MAG TPA: sodium:solute symporter family protein [Lacipirellulaceae bacterium]|nr:sodium:solute symporter family protein [Lacipirellulaceae bacterium]
MELHPIDTGIIVLYLLGMIAVGFVVERRAHRGIGSYFLGGNEIPWWVLSMSNAASMFDISGTMWLVYLLFVYGLKSVFIPWLWPVFNQIFLMVYLSAWLRRSGVITGAEWITLRFGNDRGAEASRLSVVIFALTSVIAFTGYAYIGIKEFAAIFLPASIPPDTYALIIIGVTTLYTIVGGLYSVVLTDLIQFVIMIVSSIALGCIAMWKMSPEALARLVPKGWTDISFGWLLHLDWSHLMPAAQEKIASDGYTLFGAFFGMTVFKGILVSMAGPAPNYDMQRVLAAKTPREASMMSGFVTVALFVPRYFMIAGITVLAFALVDPHLTTVSDGYFEQLLPRVIRDFVPVGLKGLLLAGLLAAFMSTFASTINSAAAYLINDVYKRYCRPRAADREFIRASYLASLLVVVAGCAAGLYMPSVATATNWIVSGLWVGYAAANVLKWHWWRLNGWGYFWGMVIGIAGAVSMAWNAEFMRVLEQPSIWLVSQFTDTHLSTFSSELMAFPSLLAISLLATVIGSLVTRPEEESVLVNFYVRTRPWGFWRPIREAALREHPEFVPNRDFAFDMFNVLVGIVWQTSFVALPIYLVIRYWNAVLVCLVTIAVTSAVLKRTWYDRLGLLERQTSEVVQR